MLYVYLGDTFSEIENLKINRSLNAAGKISFSCPANRFISPIADFQNYTYQLYFRSQRLINGGLIETSVPATKNNAFIDMIEFNATDELGLLSVVGASSAANYQNESILFIVDDLLRAAGWTLGYVHGIGATDLFTIDLRENENILAQIKTMTDRVPDLHFRYGGFFDGYHRLDLGALGTPSQIAFTQGLNIPSEGIKRLPQARKKLYQQEAFGATAGTREVYLQDAYDYDNSLATHVTYPVINTGGIWVVRDLTMLEGDQVLKRYSDIKPLNVTSPSATDMEDAGYALWKACIAEFKKANTDIVLYEINSVINPTFSNNASTQTLPDLLVNSAGSNYVNDENIELNLTDYTQILTTDTTIFKPSQDIFTFRPGDVATVNGQVNMLIYNTHLETYTWLPAYSISEDLFISDIDLTFNQGRLLQVNVKTGIQNYNEAYNEIIYLAKKTGEKSANLLGVGYAVPESTGITIVSQTHSSAAPDTTLSNGLLGKLFDLTLPAIPPGTTELRFNLYSTLPNVIIETVTNASLTNSWLGKVTFDGDWTTSKSATLYGVFIFR